MADAAHQSLGLLLAQKGNHTAGTGPPGLGPVAAGDLEKVKALLKGNPDLVFSKDSHGETPLHWAAIRGHKDVAELLLANRAEVNARDNKSQTPLHLAAVNGHEDVAKFLRQHGGHE